jgi:hypothetical protein
MGRRYLTRGTRKREATGHGKATRLAANVVRPHRHVRDLPLGHLPSVEHEHTDTATACLASRPLERTVWTAVSRLWEDLRAVLIPGYPNVSLDAMTHRTLMCDLYAANPRVQVEPVARGPANQTGPRAGTANVNARSASPTRRLNVCQHEHETGIARAARDLSSGARMPPY